MADQVSILTRPVSRVQHLLFDAEPLDYGRFQSSPGP